MFRPSQVKYIGGCLSISSLALCWSLLKQQNDTFSCRPLEVTESDMALISLLVITNIISIQTEICRGGSLTDVTAFVVIKKWAKD